ncbi:transglycosylase domain-containing protein [Flammeovirga yaeyamensis]|uniref:Transglycosylase domain-containing protein n=1 Tax=Flammeovirga yaeyamensis TaxID=367791 RepID=A0AAX1N0C4_9BACT|nr:transglycosylase domain-containing protein [Flammeovirga yaeyamensis]MBB3700127.1 penicillin-binding protein 1A [Flammeovirga yaeyamensis]NMF37242.1 glycosyltransferase [Flammeovirga yaeyamensis]QWG00930.1 transglycosylase domain-containing protein [Flammeovirga yaeyamensis]
MNPINHYFQIILSFSKKHWKLLLVSFLGLMGIGILLLTLFLGGYFGPTYSDEEILSFQNDEASEVFSEDRVLLGKYFSENRTNAQFEDLPDYLIQALVATEDARYFEHEGVDSRSVLRVMVKSVLLGDKSSGGGSTITQQLAKNMFGRKDYGIFSMLINKSGEIKTAQQLERLYSKNEILALYLNTIPFGESIYGIETASQRFFNKKVNDLRIEEAAVLIGMLKANTYYNPRKYPEHALERRNVVLHQMMKYDYITKSQYDSLSKLPISLDYANKENNGIADYFLSRVKIKAQSIITEYNQKNGTHYDIEADGLKIHTTLNSQLQKYAIEAVERQLKEKQEALLQQYKMQKYKTELQQIIDRKFNQLNVENTVSKQEYFTWEGNKVDDLSVKDSIRNELLLLHAGYLAIHPQNGEVKAYVGGIDFQSHPYDQVMAKRQLASTFKPILYAVGLENGYYPCKYIKNELDENEEGWKPSNYSKTSGGMYSMAAALAKSLNIPTVRIYNKVPFDDLKELWDNLQFEEEIKDFPSTALGTTDASIWELSEAYASFANGGFYVQPSMITEIIAADGTVLYTAPKVPYSHRVMQESTAIQMTAMLQKVMNEGTGVGMRSRYGVTLPLAGKTGTSQNYGDAWFATYNPNLVIISRVGASTNQIHFSSGRNGSGSALALPITAYSLQKVQKDRQLKHWFIPFDATPSYLSNAMNCEDYKEGTDVEMFFKNIFKPKSKEEKQKRKELRKEKRQKRKEKRGI